MAHIAGFGGQVYSGNFLVEDCEDAWDEHTETGVAVSTTTGKVGNAARATTTGVGANKLLMSEVIAKNLVDYDGLLWYMRSSIPISAGDMKILLDDSAECGSPLELLNAPALVGNTWKRCFSRFTNPAALGSLVSIGLKQITDLADGAFDIDDVRAVAVIDGIKSWALDYVVEMLDVTTFADAGKRKYIAGLSGWSGSFEGYKTGVPLDIGNKIWLVLEEHDSAGQSWAGEAYITAVHPNVSVDGIVSYAYDFQGTGELEVASA